LAFEEGRLRQDGLDGLKEEIVILLRQATRGAGLARLSLRRAICRISESPSK
jgi:hypothetical protein